MKVTSYITALVLFGFLGARDREFPGVENQDSTTAIASVDTLETTQDSVIITLPETVGPLYLHLPKLEELTLEKTQPDTGALLSVTLDQYSSPSDLRSSGTFFRNLELSTDGSSQFSGGLHFQLTGDLGNRIRVSGVLADETLPIQPDGTTASLKELDRVYLKIEHPYGQIYTGDVLLESNTGMFYRYRRSMVGIQGRFKMDSWSGTAGLGGSKGSYRTMELKGQEGNQGPYFLTARDGNRNITVAAGSEKVWLDGQRLTRGESYDYTIDYTTGELYFTPEHLIHFDSEIHVEYQYLDHGYRQDIIETSLSKEWGTGGGFQVSYFSERDRSSTRLSRFSKEDLGLLRQSGDEPVEKPAAVADSSGEYILANGIYIYDPYFADGSDRYSVHFIYDGAHGEYRRRVSTTGSVYYEYVPPEERSRILDLYSPARRLKPPTARRLVHIEGNIPLTRKIQLSSELAYSVQDKNTLSPLQDRDNSGYAQRFSLTGHNIQFGGDTELSYDLEYWNEGSRFAPLQWDRSVTFNSDWDLTKETGNGERIASLKSTLQKGDQIQNNLDISQLKYGSEIKNRVLNNFTYNGKYINELKIYYNSIDSRYNFRKDKISAILLPGHFHPYLKWDHELAQGRYRYQYMSAGYQYEKHTMATSLGVGRRLDWLGQQERGNSALQLSSKGYFGEFDYRLKTSGGWNQNITVRKRLLNDYRNGKSSDFNNYRVNLNYLRRTSPIRYDLLLVSESSLTESRATVYDSVGVGLGYYRYDPQFNDYIPDPTGAYIARTVFTGDRKPEKRSELTQRLGVDLGSLPFIALNHLTYRLDMKAEYRGQGDNLNILTSKTFGNQGITRVRLYLRHELDYNLSPQRRWKGWTFINRDLNGFDPRGQEFRQQQETGIYFQETVSDRFKLTGSGNRHSTQVKSEWSASKERKFNGLYLEGGFMLFPDPALKSTVVYIHRFDKGIVSTNDGFSAYSNGMRGDLTGFIGKKGRIELGLEFHRASGNSVTIPPEALNGLAPGNTVRLNVEGSYLVGNVLSVGLNLRYQDDSRFNHFITVAGEIRAQF
jgi:hypothetical protein